MATVTLLEKARQRRLNALASLGTAERSRERHTFISIFDNAFDDRAEDTMLVAKNNVIAFRSTRKDLVAVNDQAAPDRVAA